MPIKKTTVEPVSVVVTPTELISKLEARLEEGNLTDAQRESIEARIASMQAGAIISTKGGGSYENLPEGLYISEVAAVSLRRKDLENDRGEPVTKFDLSLTLKPLYGIDRDDDGVVVEVELDEDNKYGHHWVDFNTTVNMIHNPDATTQSGISKFIAQLGLAYDGISGIAPYTLDHDCLVGLQVFERVKHHQAGAKTYVNSSLARDLSIGLNKGLGKVYKKVKGNNTPILETWLAVPELTYSKY